MISSGYIGSIVSSLERYYGFSTSRLGVAFSSYDIMGVISIPLISYFGSQNNRPRIVAFGALLFAIGNILFILPYLINGYEKERSINSSNQITNHLCQSNSSNQKIYSHDLCSSLSTAKILSHLTPNLIDKHISTSYVTPQPTWTYYILILSMIIMSIGASPFYTLGITFLTDHLNKDDQAICTSKFNYFSIEFFVFLFKRLKKKNRIIIFRSKRKI
jgi:MFS family permease